MRTLILKMSGMLSLFAMAKSAMALPILAETEAYRAAQLLTLYPDSRDPNKFYFAPNSGGFAKMDNGLPTFGFTYWGLRPAAEDAGAYMSFTMKLAIDNAQRKAIEEFLKERPNARVAPLPLMESMIGLDTTNTNSPPLGRFFEEWNFAHRGGRLEDEIGVNSIMSKLGARVMLKSIENPQLLKLDYCYKTQGLGPNLRAKITANMRWIYDHFSATASGGGFWFKASVSRTVENLIQNGSVKVEIEGGTAADETFVRSVADKIIERVFKVELEAKPGAHTAPSGWSFSKLSLNSTHREQLKTETWEYERRDLVEREFCLPLKLTEVSANRDQIVKNADE